MIRQLIRSYVLLVAVAIALFTVPVAFTLTDQLRDDTSGAVLREARTMARLLGTGDTASCAALAKMAGAYPADEEKVEVTATNRCAREGLREPSADAALTEALDHGRSTVDWGSDFIWGDNLVVTVPAFERSPDGKSDKENVVGAVRVKFATDHLTARLWQIWGFRAGLAVLVLLAAAIIGVYAARRLTAPLRQLNEMASKMSDGDLTARSPVTGPQETQTLARTLNQAGERLDTLIASQRIFVADASHQLRTPLTALRLSLDNIADGTDDEFVREDVEQATAEVVRMSRLVNGLLVLARAEAKVTAAEPLSLREIIQERLDVWRPAADERGVTITLRGSADGRPLVLASPGHLDQVLDNVLSNALEVSPDGATITVLVESRGDEVVLSVLDEGPGMSDAEKSRAFDRFWRGQGLTGKSGSGLGLAVVKQLVTDDNGTVALKDAPGGGLCVALTLRAARHGGG
ncbi:HAMP domain-containing sensor histidine kinase [Streptomyces scabiei]|uniref:HAMP domain-containing sensor histidine kinase n=1 Tax=Streptomyces scabiei TaxID=1930 RepID=UPI000765B6B6|nr:MULTISPECIES: HAMP domain-containing sensor histidine kinase [Streptomyces]MBP5868853.1 HAMP domain-containing histidine kinase [Streptomyces sp. LBUM 1485]MBP5929753.1 HAMP domain-containing histidine kinase [Streptomyces sp. LBUM 1479]MBP5915224.1 HAMP domain-containing histidine kinase [Streptomyces sp. LBUM 1486]MDX2535622.1 HAMP domain-containing sensor histidine kinase [Streptomyces scabiei]MDX2796881.1 HAMP domain-containing sensor histidine kinase [Streptomyces scabiei]